MSILSETQARAISHLEEFLNESKEFPDSASARHSMLKKSRAVVMEALHVLQRWSSKYD